MNRLKLKPLEDTDVSLMEIWLNKKHIKEWYDIPGLCTVNDWLNEIKCRNDEFKFITHFMALYGEKPIGFGQYYKCEDVCEDWYGETPLTGTYSIDYLIGEEDYLGKGFGKLIIMLLVEKIFALPDSKRIIVQPDEKNNASCNALLSNGFVLDTSNNVYLK
ncbi:MAG: acetyltransferase [Oscillospiraceae bacterium]|nr:acetyltransferase [Oscillospiraceae bacterium]